MSRQIVDKDSGNKQFDARVHHIDSKGKLIKYSPYSKYCFGDREYYLDDASKKLYFPDGSEIPADQIPAELRHLASPAPQAAPARPVATPAPATRGRAAKAVAETNPEPALEDQASGL
jgi:hypothetical protein